MKKKLKKSKKSKKNIKNFTPNIPIFYQILSDEKKYGLMQVPEEIQNYYASKGWENILFRYVGDGHNDPRGQKMIWITNKRYTPNGNRCKRGFMYLSTKQSKEEQFYIDDEPIFYRIRSYGIFS